MMTFRYIKGDWKDFCEAPDEAMLLVIDTVGRKYFTDIFPEPGGKYWSELSSHGVWGNAVKPDAFVLIAVREKLAGWDGEGLPPVGVRCEFISNDTSWGEVDVIGIDGGKVVFKPSGETYYGIVPSQRQIFRPIRSEADRKKEAAIFAIAELCRESASNGHSGELIYDAIKSGKIVID